MHSGCRCIGINSNTASKKTFANMDACCSRFTAPEGGARLAAVAAEKNTLAVEYSAFISTRLLHEDAYKIRGTLSEGFKRSVYITRASRVACVAYELHILTDLIAVKALQYADEDDWGSVLEEKQVLVCTSQVIKMILQEGVLTIPQINVLIIDSCHLIFEDENLQYVMKCYKLCKQSEQPRILALTYPLFTSNKDSEAQNDNTSNNNTQNTNDTQKTANIINETSTCVKDETKNNEMCGNNVEITDEKQHSNIDVSKSAEQQAVEDKYDEIKAASIENLRVVEILDGGTGVNSVKRDVNVMETGKKENGDDSPVNDVAVEYSSKETKKDVSKQTSSEISENVSELITDTLNNKSDNAQIKDEASEQSDDKKEKETSHKTAEDIKQTSEKVEPTNDVSTKSEEKKKSEEDNAKNNETSHKTAKDINLKTVKVELKDELTTNSDEKKESEEESGGKNKEKLADEKIDNAKPEKGADESKGIENKMVSFKKYIKTEDLVVGANENLDDFDMYEKLEWKIEELERALCCKMDLAEDIDGGKRLANTIAKPKEILLEYSGKASSESISEAYLDLERYMREEVAKVIDFMDEHRYDPSEIYGEELYEEYMNIPDPTIEPKIMFNQFIYVLDQLGPYAADKAAFSLLVKLEKLRIKVPYERHFLLLCLCTSLFVKIRCYADLILSKYDDWERIRLFSTPKVLRFAEILEQFQPPDNFSKGDNDVDEKSKKLEDDSVRNNVEVYDVDDSVVKELKNEIKEDTVSCKNECSVYSSDIIDTNDFDDIPKRITEIETIINNTKNTDNNENLKDCTDAISCDNSNLIDNIKAKGNEETDDSYNQNPSEEQSNSNNDRIVDKNVSESGLCRSKTTELLNELDKCDFITLGNKIEDRVNSYEANLKDLDDIIYYDDECTDKDKVGKDNPYFLEIDHDIVGNNEFKELKDNRSNKDNTKSKIDDNLQTIDNTTKLSIQSDMKTDKDSQNVTDLKSETKTNYASIFKPEENMADKPKANPNSDAPNPKSTKVDPPDPTIDSKTNVAEIKKAENITDESQKNDDAELTLDNKITIAETQLPIDIIQHTNDKLSKVETQKTTKANMTSVNNIITAETPVSTDINEDIDNKTKALVQKLDPKLSTDSKSEAETTDAKPSLGTNTSTVETQKVQDIKTMLEFRQKTRRTHRTRGRGRVARSQAARLQQIQQNPDALCGIVFMKEPLVAKIMFMIVVDMSRSRPSLSHLCAQYCAVESEGDDSRPQGKKHEDVLKKFRMHECNLLLATPALEEGIDLPRCNLVIRWDVPPSYRSHGLCRSRARAPRSCLALMAEAPASSEELLNNLAVYKEMDQIISRKCGCGVQNEPPAKEEVHADIFTTVIKPYTPSENRETQQVGEKIHQSSEKTQETGDQTQQSNVQTQQSDEQTQHSNVQTQQSDEQTRQSDIQTQQPEKQILIGSGNTENDGDRTKGEEMIEDDVKNTKVNEVIGEVYISNKSVHRSNNEVLKAANGYNIIDCKINDEGGEGEEESSKNKRNDGEVKDTHRVIVKEIVDGITKEVKRTEVIVKQLDNSDVCANKKFNKNSDLYGNDDKNCVLSNENTENECKLNNNNIPRDENSVNSNFNVVYDLSKSVCECENDMCKCNLSMDGDGDKKTENGQCSVDLSTAIALINRYCGKLPSDTFTRLAPQYWMEEVQLPDKLTGQLRTAYICTLRLPLNCPVKYNIVGHPMPTRVLARRMVALQACRILHKSGELDNQLMPIGKENFKAAELESTVHSDTENNDSARPGTTKRRQYYYKRTASAFTDCQPLIDSTDAEIENQTWEEAKDAYKARFAPDTKKNTLFCLSSRLWCALPERYNTRGRRLHAPQNASHAQAVLMATSDPNGLQIPAFPVYTRSGEVRVSIEPALEADVRLSPRRAKLVRRFMRFVFSDVLRVRRRGMRLQTEGSTQNNYYIVPTVRVTHEDGTSHVDIDWSFLELIYKHTEEKKNSVEKPVLLRQDDEEEEEEVVEKRAPKREREKDGKVKKMDNPYLKPGEVFVFDADKYRDAVVTPWYRNQDQPQYFLVAEICWNLSPDSAFPSVSHGSFRDYYSSKYGVTLTQPNQPLLDVDHTSARLNLLTPRYVNRKGVALPVSSERTRRAKRDRLDQKQILVPELCTVHPFAAPLWFATVALPCVLYRINALLIADEIRRAVSADVALGALPLRGVPSPQWPPLDFGWSLAEVLNTEEKGDKNERKKEEEDSRKVEKAENNKEEKEPSKEENEEDGVKESAEVREKTINDILQEKEDAESGFEIGTWSNDMASSIPQEEYDEFMEPLPPNLTFCTSASGGANWSDPIQKPKAPFGAPKAFSMAESDCSYMSSDFDTDESDLNSEGSDDDMDSGGFGGKNYASMGVRIEYKTAHEAEAVDLERKVKACTAPQYDEEDDAKDQALQRRVFREGRPPDEYIEKYKKSIIKHKKAIKRYRLITKDNPIKEMLPDTAKEMYRLRRELNVNLRQKKLKEVMKEMLETRVDEYENGYTVENSINSFIDEDTSNIKINSSEQSGSQSNFNLNDSDRRDNCEGNHTCRSVLTKEGVKDTDLGSQGKELEVTVDISEESTNNKLKPGIDNDVKETNRFILEVNENKHDGTNKTLVETITDTNEVTKTNTELSMNDVAIDNLEDFRGTFKNELLDEIFPYGDALDFQNGQVTLESIEKNKRVILKKFKESLTKEDVEKLNCFSMLDIDIDSPDYVNEKIVNVGFDTKESYVEKVNAFRNPKEYTPYCHDNKAQNGKEFDFDYQPDLEGHPGPSPSVILQALTMSNANDGINLERLETIGDSFLKFAITAYLYCAHPAVHEGKLSHMRSKQVSNLNLYRLGRNKRLGARMIASKFEPHDNWLPPCHKPPPTHHPTSGDQEIQMQKDAATDTTGCFIPYNLITQHSIPDKSIADCVEALIGAYLLECGPRGALLFMAWLGIGVLPRHVLPLPRDHPALADLEKPPAAASPASPASPQRWSSSSSPSSSEAESEAELSDEEAAPRAEGAERGPGWRGRPLGSLPPRRDKAGRWVQTVFGELRAPPSPLLRYVEDPEGELERMLSGYDALERTLQYRFRDRSLLLQALTHASHHQNRLTDCYQRLEFLGDAILDYLITRHLYEDARRHSPGALTDLRSALVNNTIFATLAARHGFHKYFRHMSPGLNEVLTKYVKIQEENGHSISEEHYLIQEDEMEQAEDVEVPKALGDLFESVAGAIFLDSGMSLSAVWRSYVRLMGAELEAFSAAAPKSPVRELLEAEPDTAKFGKPERLADGRRVRVCVEVFGRGAFKGIGRNYRIAKGTAARCALRHLRGTRDSRH